LKTMHLRKPRSRLSSITTTERDSAVRRMRSRICRHPSLGDAMPQIRRIPCFHSVNGSSERPIVQGGRDQGGDGLDSRNYCFGALRDPLQPSKRTFLSLPTISQLVQPERYPTVIQRSRMPVTPFQPFLRPLPLCRFSC
jgi:hypothetical protein